MLWLEEGGSEPAPHGLESLCAVLNWGIIPEYILDLSFCFFNETLSIHKFHYLLSGFLRELH